MVFAFAGLVRVCPRLLRPGDVTAGGEIVRPLFEGIGSLLVRSSCSFLRVMLAPLGGAQGLLGLSDIRTDAELPLPQPLCAGARRLGALGGQLRPLARSLRRLSRIGHAREFPALRAW